MLQSALRVCSSAALWLERPASSGLHGAVDAVVFRRCGPGATAPPGDGVFVGGVEIVELGDGDFE